MRCYICDATLTQNEIHFDTKHNKWDPCIRCLKSIEEQPESKTLGTVGDLIVDLYELADEETIIDAGW